MTEPTTNVDIGAMRWGFRKARAWRARQRAVKVIKVLAIVAFVAVLTATVLYAALVLGPSTAHGIGPMNSPIPCLPGAICVTPTAPAAMPAQPAPTPIAAPTPYIGDVGTPACHCIYLPEVRW